MVLTAQYGLCAIGMLGIQRTKNSLNNLSAVISKTHVLLLVHCFQFGMETTYHVVLETVGLYLCPVVQLVRGYILHIARHIVTGICIGA